MLVSARGSVRSAAAKAAHWPRARPAPFGCRLQATGPGMHQTPIVDLLWRKRKQNAQPSAFQTTAPTSQCGADQCPRAPKTPEQSQTTITYEFSKAENAALVDKYRNPSGNVRPARLLEDLDALAGTIAFDHCRSDTPGAPELHIVTASVDRIKYMHRPTLTDDIVLSGRVTWVGRSSMEIQMRAQVASSRTPILESLFTFVARDKATGRAAQIPELRVSGEEQERLFQLGAKRDAYRKQLRKLAYASPLGSRLDEEGLKMAESLYMEAQPLIKMPMLANPMDVFMEETKLSNTFMTMPQHQNTAGRVFGGFLMRRAYELAFCTANLFCGRRPIFHELDEVTFKAPVSIGDLVRFESFVLYTSGTVDIEGRATIHTEVRASVLKPDSRTFVPSNSFNFTFGVPKSADGAGPSAKAGEVELRRVLPRTRSESFQIVERFMADLKQREEDDAER